MKKNAILILAIAVLVSVALAGCYNTTPTPTPTKLPMLTQTNPTETDTGIVPPLPSMSPAITPISVNEAQIRNTASNVNGVKDAQIAFYGSKIVAAIQLSNGNTDSAGTKLAVENAIKGAANTSVSVYVTDDTTIYTDVQAALEKSEDVSAKINSWITKIQ